jgi:hypothetical protein
MPGRTVLMSLSQSAIRRGPSGRETLAQQGGIQACVREWATRADAQTTGIYIRPPRRKWAFRDVCAAEGQNAYHGNPAVNISRTRQRRAQVRQFPRCRVCCFRVFERD